MRHPMIASLLGLAASAMNALSFQPTRGTTGKRGRSGSHCTNPDMSIDGMRQSLKDRDVKLRGYAGAKMDRKAKAKTLGLRHGTSAYMKWGRA